MDSQTYHSLPMPRDFSFAHGAPAAVGTSADRTNISATMVEVYMGQTFVGFIEEKVLFRFSGEAARALDPGVADSKTNKGRSDKGSQGHLPRRFGPVYANVRYPQPHHEDQTKAVDFKVNQVGEQPTVNAMKLILNYMGDAQYFVGPKVVPDFFPADISAVAFNSLVDCYMAAVVTGLRPVGPYSLRGEIQDRLYNLKPTVH